MGDLRSREQVKEDATRHSQILERLAVDILAVI